MYLLGDIRQSLWIWEGCAYIRDVHFLKKISYQIYYEMGHILSLSLRFFKHENYLSLFQTQYKYNSLLHKKLGKVEYMANLAWKKFLSCYAVKKKVKYFMLHKGDINWSS